MNRKTLTIVATMVILLLCGCTDTSNKETTIADSTEVSETIAEETTSSTTPVESQEVTTEPEKTDAPTIAYEEELTLSGFIAYFKDIYIDEFNMSLSKPIEVEDGGLIMYRYAIKNEDGLVLPCTISVVCNDNNIVDSIIVAYYEDGDSSVAQQIVDVWAYAFASFNQSLSPFDGYSQVMRLYESGDFEEDGYKYYYYEDALSVGICRC